MEIDQATLDLLAKTAAEDAAKSFPFLRFTRETGAPEWKVGDTFTTDAEVIPRTDEAARSYMRFAPGVKAPVEETAWVVAMGNERPKRPNSFTDESEWDTWTGGRRKDPWVYRTRMPVQIKTGPLAGRIALFNGDNAASRDVVAEMQIAFAKTGKRPLVLLTHEMIGNEAVPAFKIIRLTEDDAATPGLNHLAHDPNASEKPAAKPAGKSDVHRPPGNGGGDDLDEPPDRTAFERKPFARDEIDDDIPFALAFIVATAVAAVAWLVAGGGALIA